MCQHEQDNISKLIVGNTRCRSSIRPSLARIGEMVWEQRTFLCFKHSSIHCSQNSCWQGAMTGSTKTPCPMEQIYSSSTSPTKNFSSRHMTKKLECDYTLKRRRVAIRDKEEMLPPSDDTTRNLTPKPMLQLYGTKCGNCVVHNGCEPQAQHPSQWPKLRSHRLRWG